TTGAPADTSARGADQAADSNIRRPRNYYAIMPRRLAALQSLILLCGQVDHSALVIPDLIRALHDESRDVRLYAACLGQIQGDRTPAIPKLIQALDDTDPWVVSAAALSLRAIGPAAESAAPHLRRLLDDVRNRSTNLIRFSRNY